MIWFWTFIFYSLAGYGLEKLYAFAVRARHRVRKCFLLLPLCPVYGLAMVAVLRLAGDTESFWQLALYGGRPVLGLQRHPLRPPPAHLLPLCRGLGTALGPGGAPGAAAYCPGAGEYLSGGDLSCGAAAHGRQLLYRPSPAPQP